MYTYIPRNLQRSDPRSTDPDKKTLSIYLIAPFATSVGKVLFNFWWTYLFLNMESLVSWSRGAFDRQRSAGGDAYIPSLGELLLFCTFFWRGNAPRTQGRITSHCQPRVMDKQQFFLKHVFICSTSSIQYGMQQICYFSIYTPLN